MSRNRKPLSQREVARKQARDAEFTFRLQMQFSKSPLRPAATAYAGGGDGSTDLDLAFNILTTAMNALGFLASPETLAGALGAVLNRYTPEIRSRAVLHIMRGDNLYMEDTITYDCSVCEKEDLGQPEHEGCEGLAVETPTIMLRVERLFDPLTEVGPVEPVKEKTEEEKLKERLEDKGIVLPA